MRSRICILARYFPSILQLEKLTHFAPPKFSSGFSSGSAHIDYSAVYIIFGLFSINFIFIFRSFRFDFVGIIDCRADPTSGIACRCMLR